MEIRDEYERMDSGGMDADRLLRRLGASRKLTGVQVCGVYGGAGPGGPGAHPAHHQAALSGYGADLPRDARLRRAGCENAGPVLLGAGRPGLLQPRGVCAAAVSALQQRVHRYAGRVSPIRAGLSGAALPACRIWGISGRDACGPGLKKKT